jgi:hypothetical protein
VISDCKRDVALEGKSAYDFFTFGVRLFGWVLIKQGAVTMKFNRLLIAAFAICVVSNTIATPLQDAIEADYKFLDTLFKHLHANPELSMQEFKTSDRLASELASLG